MCCVCRAEMGTSVQTLLPQIHHEPLLPVQPTSPKAGNSLYFSTHCEAYVLEFREEAAAEQRIHKI